MTFLKNFLIILAIDGIALLLRFLLSLIISSSEDKLKSKSKLHSGRPSAFFIFVFLAASFLFMFINCLIGTSLILFILYNWEKAFVIGLLIISFISLLYSLYTTYGLCKDLIDNYGKSIVGILLSFFTIFYISSWIIYLSSSSISVAFESADFAQDIIHFIMFAIFSIINTTFVILLLKQKPIAKTENNSYIY